jgi:hypothetical protein
MNSSGATKKVTSSPFHGSIEMLVLSVSPTTAFELLVLLIERDGDAMEQCGDDHWSVQMKLETAAELVAKAMKSLPSRNARQTWEGLVAEDGYGTRAPLCNARENVSVAAKHESREKGQPEF